MSDSQVIDLLIIGGGINGAGIARDAAGRGLKVALVEQGDLASATSSASTKLIHGGLRYLEQFEFRLVREALIERERLLEIAPHLISPMDFVLPYVDGLRPRWQIRMGLFLYDHLGGRQHLPASKGLKLSKSAYGRPLRPHLRHAFMYSDCWVDDSRLVVMNAIDAAQRGASILPRTKFIDAKADGQHWIATCIDQATQQRHPFRARAIVNAAGPWVEKVLEQFVGPHHDLHARLVKGSHIVVPRLYEGEYAYLLQHPDGRVVFTIPYEQHFTLIGTTDVSFEGDPHTAAITSDEIQYLCETTNRYFRRMLAPEDVLWTYAGVRPLVEDRATSASKVTRDYKLHLVQSDDAPALLSVFGGKITTYRRLAEHALEKLQPILRFEPGEWTGNANLPGGDLPQGDFDLFVDEVQERWPFLPESMALRLAHAYGTRIELILHTAQRLDDLGRDFGGYLTDAEISYLRQHEWARDPEDFLWRRTKCGLHMSPEQRERFAAAVAALA
ncbi:MAG TPA: glycerol-3-phosphate dehydrogenase [Steroidobacteraceae bacterium]|nr:glycerol-3-phosphate dehydrogenase [Steroidobacteraceae bacterium]